MSNNHFGTTFTHITKDMTQRNEYFLEHSIQISNNNIMYYPFLELQKLAVSSVNLVDAKSLIDYYLFKQNYYSLILKNILHIENALKEAIAFVIGKNYGDHTYINDKSIDLANDYLSLNNYTTNKSIKDVKYILKNLKSKIYNPPKYCTTIKKFRTESNIPPYILAKDLMFSGLLDWYWILNDRDKDEVISLILQREIDENKKLEIREFFILSIRLLNEIRNNYAHSNEGGYSETNFKGIPYSTFKFLFSSDSFNESLSRIKYNKFMKKSPVSIGLLCIIVLLDEISKEQFMVDFISTFEMTTLERISKEEIKIDLDVNEFIMVLENLWVNSVKSDESSIY